MTIASSTTKPVEIVSAISVRLFRLKPSRYITPNVPTSESGTATLGMTVAAAVRRKRKMTMTTRPMVSISSNSTSWTEARIVVVRSVRIETFTAEGSEARSCGQERLDAVDDLDDVRARLALDVHDDGRRLVHPGGLLHVLGVVDDVGHVGEMHGGAVPVGDDEGLVLLAREELVVRPRSSRTGAAPSKAPLAWLTFACESAVRTSSRVRPYDESAVGFTWTRTAGFWPPLMLTRPTPGSCEIFWARRVSAGPRPSRAGSVSDVRASVRIGASAGLILL